jgi:hypothetical protein
MTWTGLSCRASGTRCDRSQFLTSFAPC